VSGGWVGKEESPVAIEIATVAVQNATMAGHLSATTLKVR